MYSGYTGAVKLVNVVGDTSTIAYISGWSLEDKTEIIDSSEFNSANKQSLAGAKSWSASANGVVSFADGDGQTKLLEAKNAGLPLVIDFYLDVDNKTFFTGSCYIESLSFDLAADGVANISISVVGDGELEYVVNGQSMKIDPEERGVTFFLEENGHIFVKIPERLADRVKCENGEVTIIV